MNPFAIMDTRNLEKHNQRVYNMDIQWTFDLSHQTTNCVGENCDIFAVIRPRSTRGLPPDKVPNPGGLCVTNQLRHTSAQIKQFQYHVNAHRAVKRMNYECETLQK
jgi:hypothetical protein